jgi:hypothetical protein
VLPRPSLAGRGLSPPAPAGRGLSVYVGGGPYPAPSGRQHNRVVVGNLTRGNITLYAPPLVLSVTRLPYVRTLSTQPSQAGSPNWCYYYRGHRRSIPTSSASRQQNRRTNHNTKPAHTGRLISPRTQITINEGHRPPTITDKAEQCPPPQSSPDPGEQCPPP